MKLEKVTEKFNPRLFHEAKLLAETLSVYQKQTHVAFVLGKGKRVLSVGVNSFVKSSYFQRECAQESGFRAKEFLHAEVSGLNKCKSAVATSILVVRFNKKGQLRNSMPCEVCQLAATQKGIKKIYHS